MFPFREKTDFHMHCSNPKKQLATHNEGGANKHDYQQTHDRFAAGLHCGSKTLHCPPLVRDEPEYMLQGFCKVVLLELHHLALILFRLSDALLSHLLSLPEGDT